MAMSILETIADGLAKEALALEEELDDPDFVDKVAKQIGAASPTTEEAFKTAVRMRRAERNAQRFMVQLKERKTSS